MFHILFVFIGLLYSFTIHFNIFAELGKREFCTLHYFKIIEIIEDYWNMSIVWIITLTGQICCLWLHRKKRREVQKHILKKKGRKFVWAAPKMVSFFTAGSWEKDPIFGAAQTNFHSFLFWQGFMMKQTCTKCLR